MAEVLGHGSRARPTRAGGDMGLFDDIRVHLAMILVLAGIAAVVALTK